jgi:uncharacterized protein
MSCRYCYVNHEEPVFMSKDTARKAVDLTLKDGRKSNGIIFFGGEPLLCKNIIYDTIEYARWKEKQNDCMFYFKVTTNGLLLDKDFMELSLKENIFIALSHDGIQQSHDNYRIDANEKGTFSKLSEKINLLLSNRPYAPVLMVTNPDTAECLVDSVIYLYERGFRYIICSLNYAAPWAEKDMDILEKQYKRLAEFYFEKTLAEEKFYLSPFEVKISSHINSNSYCHERCELGKKQISVAPDGALYPCVQFVGDKDYCIGHIDTGINRVIQDRVYDLNEKEKEGCNSCAVRKRCNHYCGCMNKQSTGSIEKVSPVLCRHERLLLPIADKLAEKLFKKRNGMFIQKHYNDMFPVLSMIEDNSNQKGV